jgi:hypothetical protein
VELLVREHLNVQTIVQYRQEERSQTARRIKADVRGFQALISSMRKTTLAPPDHVQQLAEELGQYHDSAEFEGLPTMADLVERHLNRLLTDRIHE